MIRREKPRRRHKPHPLPTEDNQRRITGDPPPLARRTLVRDNLQHGIMRARGHEVKYRGDFPCPLLDLEVRCDGVVGLGVEGARLGLDGCRQGYSIV